MTQWTTWEKWNNKKRKSKRKKNERNRYQESLGRGHCMHCDKNVFALYWNSSQITCTKKKKKKKKWKNVWCNKVRKYILVYTDTPIHTHWYRSDLKHYLHSNQFHFISFYFFSLMICSAFQIPNVYQSENVMNLMEIKRKWQTPKTDWTDSARQHFKLYIDDIWYNVTSGEWMVTCEMLYRTDDTT